MTREGDAAQRARVQAQLASCLRAANAAATELQGLRERVGPIETDVMRIVGSTAQGTDTAMIEALGRARSAIEGALSACAHARQLIRATEAS